MTGGLFDVVRRIALRMPYERLTRTIPLAQ